MAIYPKLEKIGEGEYKYGSLSISRKSGTDWTVSGENKDGTFFRSTVESFNDARQVAKDALAEDEKIAKSYLSSKEPAPNCKTCHTKMAWTSKATKDYESKIKEGTSKTVLCLKCGKPTTFFDLSNPRANFICKTCGNNMKSQLTGDKSNG